MNDFAKVQVDVARAIPHEERFRKEIEDIIGKDLRKDVRQQNKKSTPIDFDPIDYMVFDKDCDIVKGYIEIKVRPKYSTKTIPDVIIDHRKMVAFQLKNFTTGIPVFYAIRFKDKDIVYEYNPTHHFPIKHGGRTKNTRTAYDIKEVQYIPMKYFRDLKKESIVL